MDYLLRMKVKDKEKLNNPLKGWQILNAIFLNGFSHCALVELHREGSVLKKLIYISSSFRGINF